MAFFPPQGLFCFSWVIILMSLTQNPAEPLQKNCTKSVTDEAILKVTKEIVVKFIEVGRLSPANFDETFEQVYRTVLRSVRS